MSQWCVVAGHHETAGSAAEVLRIGGNAFDAAVSALATSFVCEPCMSSAAGGAFMTAYTAQYKALCLDFFTQSPKEKRPSDEIDFFPVTVDFGDTKEDFHIGLGSAAVPGSVAGLFEIHRLFGSIPIKELLQPAISLAKNGVGMTPFQRLDFVLLEPILANDARGKELFFKEDGSLLDLNDIFYAPQLADFLDYLSTEGPNAFYKGEVAQKIVADMQSRGGHLSLKDLETYQCIRRKPLSFNYKNKTLITNPLPSSGGSVLAVILQFLDQTPQLSVKSAAFTNSVIEALIHQNQIGFKAEELSAALVNSNSPNWKGKRGSTTHFGILDARGNAVAITTTNGEGAGYIIPGTDIMMNNMLGEAALHPDGFHSWPCDQRIPSMMSPTIVVDENGSPEIICGGGGAGRIPSSIAQTIHYLLSGNLALNDAVHAPRMHLVDDVLNMEPGFATDDRTHQLDVRISEWKSPSLYFGGTHTILNQNGIVEGAGDDRREGSAIRG